MRLRLVSSASHRLLASCLMLWLIACACADEQGAPSTEPRPIDISSVATESDAPDAPVSERPFPRGPRLGADGPVHAFALAGDTLFVGGGFEHLGLPLGGLVLRGPGSAERPPVTPPLNGRVLAAIEDGRGGLFVAGIFEVELDGRETRRFLVRVDSEGEVDPAFSPGVDRPVYALALFRDALYIGGSFGVAGGEPRRHLAAVDPVSGRALPWRADVDFTVLALDAMDDRLFVGGQFSSISGLPRSRLAAVDVEDGRVLPWDPGADGDVYALAAHEGMLLAGGTFSRVGGADRMNLAVVDARTGAVSAVAPNTDGAVFAIAAGGDRLFIAGSFTKVGGRERPALAALSLSGEALPWASLEALSVVPTVIRGMAILPDGSIAVGGATGQGFEPHMKVDHRIEPQGRESSLAAWAMLLGTGDEPEATELAVGGRLVDAVSAFGDSVALGGRLGLGAAEARAGLAAVDVMSGGLLPHAGQTRSPVLFLASDGASASAAGHSLLGWQRGRTRNLALVSTLTGELSPVDLPLDVYMIAGLAFAGEALWVACSARREETVHERHIVMTNLQGRWRDIELPAFREFTTAAGTSDRLYVAGHPRSSSEDQPSPIVALDAGSGRILDWRPDPRIEWRGTVALAPHEDQIAVGGTLYFRDGFRGSGVYLLDASTGALIPSIPRLPKEAHALAWDGGRLFAAGKDFPAGGHPDRGGFLAVLDQEEGRWRIKKEVFQGAVDTLLVRGDRIWLGGSFQTVEGRYQPNLALLSGRELFPEIFDASERAP